MVTSKLEVLVDFGPTPEAALVDRTLAHLRADDGVKEAVFKDGAIIVETTLPSSKVLEMTSEASGKRTVLQGFGEAVSAVAMVAGGDGAVLGVVRFQQTGGAAVVEGALHGLRGAHRLSVHAAGDLSDGCNSIGPHYDRAAPPTDPRTDPRRRHAGDLGVITADPSGRAHFRFIDPVLKVEEIVGRAVGVGPADGDCDAAPIACGVIARSAGVLGNPKRVCACDGVVVWDERDVPAAGPGRRAGGSDPPARRAGGSDPPAQSAGGRGGCCPGGGAAPPPQEPRRCCQQH